MFEFQDKCSSLTNGLRVDVDESEPHIGKSSCDVIAQCGHGMMTQGFTEFSRSDQVIPTLLTFFKTLFVKHKSLLGPLIHLFWTFGDFSGFQSQSGQPYLHLAETYMLHVEIHVWCNTCQPLGGQHGS